MAQPVYTAAEVVPLLDALDFYARYLLRSAKDPHNGYVLTPIEHDFGDRARAALEAFNANPKDPS